MYLRVIMILSGLPPAACWAMQTLRGIDFIISYSRAIVKDF